MDFDNILNYLNELNSNNEQKKLYDAIINFENEYFIPAVRLDTAYFLNLITKLKSPKNILEIGFGSGVSSIFIQKDFTPELFISLERDVNRYKRGINLMNHFSISGIKLLNIDAFYFFKDNCIKFDLIFLDAVKRDYIDYLEILKNNLNKNGILLVDNILFNSKTISDNLEERYKNGVNLLKKFNLTISMESVFNSVFMPIGDGLLISIMK
jgi:caffeoyl-CoA O-methyltransferase